MSTVFQIWITYFILCMIPNVLSHQSQTFDSIITRNKKIPIPSHITYHQPILCWVIKFQNGANKTFSTKNEDLKLAFISSLGELLINHFVFCHTKSKELNKRDNISNLHKAHFAINQKNQSHFSHLVDKYENGLDLHPDVEWYSQETVRSRQKRSIQFTDPYFTRQWHLVNNDILNMDINVTGVWERNITGHGVTVAVVDDGVEWNNPDLQANFNSMGSWDLNDDDSDPMPSDSKINNHHGTRCAGEIAAVANDHCGVGVAYTSKISGLRVLDGPMTDSLEASAFNKKLQINDIYSCSWGPDDDGKTVDGPHIMAAKAMKYGVDFGRRGYGSIFVVASGNGGRHQDNCNYDGYANSIYTVTIGAVDERGQMPFYAEECASMLGVSFSSGKINRDIVTTDWTKRNGAGCTEQHTGTSAAAPLAAGMIALMLQVRPCLTWRDVQYIIILTALKVDVDVAHWQKNGAGLYHSHKHGFGLLKAWRLVNAAKIWETVPWATSFSYNVKDVNLQIPKGRKKPLIINHTISEEDVQGFSLYILEYVQVTVTIIHPSRGKLSLKLKCPSGTNSIIAAERPLDVSHLGFSDWTFSTVRCWGEQPVGKWILTVTDSGHDKQFGYVKNWRLRLFGTPMSPEQLQDRRKKIEEAMSGVYLNDSYSLPCRPPPITTKSEVPITIKTLKILVLVSAFCILMAVYETLEHAFCYNDEKKEHRLKMESALRAHNASQNRNDTVTEEDVTEATGLLQDEDIAMTVVATKDSDSNRDSDLSAYPIQTISPNITNTIHPNSEDTYLSESSDKISVLNLKTKTCELNIVTEMLSSDQHAQFETLNLSDDEDEITAFDVQTSVKRDGYDWLKYTKNSR